MLENEAFALRDRERAQLSTEPASAGRWFAVMLRSASFPEGTYEKKRHSDGVSVEMAAVLACEVNQKGNWQWMFLSPPTKEIIGDLMFDSGAERDVWYYLIITEG